ncbi:MAG: Serine/threonine-protein kinase PknD [Gammaproteobacteria bacterium]|nr:Serine/threonine-protein kinase PknD [Gammaproteobacteria bacterium]
MASFSDALQALAQGQLKAEVLLTHMERALTRDPRVIDSVLAHLAKAYECGLIEAQTAAKLKAHALRTVRALQAHGGEPAGHSIVDASRAAAASLGDENATVLPFAPASGHAEIGEIDIDLTQIAADAACDAASAHASVAVGAVLKERFLLEEILGVGGMGTVYKGRDLLKVEARDKNPHVALKVLNEAFKKHPDAFIALQREASRQQKLAHPNIATVYDFDRSEGTIFLTMEYLDGQPLNSYLRRQVRPRGGLPFAEAFPIIRGLGQALAYAHEHDIVHSDFKPANCLLTTTGAVKVLDFGIARVIQGQDDSERTLFDPSSLGALTPAYASPEMLSGEEPDPRDDIYALACVAYELLSGRHPYDRKSAIHAREHALVPPAISGLGRGRMRALKRALALRRPERTPTVAAFLDELQDCRRMTPTAWFAIGIVAALLLLAAAVIVLRQAPADVAARPAVHGAAG